ncbi:MAG: CBS domain-containing protein [Candidatus Omnitrophica bacterium]|nr:CBS domain-containing protein [Candidatus Omnitrophota bacterium]
MNVRELMTPDPEACVPGDTLAVAGELMRRRHCGFAPVVDGRTTNRVVGVLTDRDLALHLTRTDGRPSQVTVEACMTKDPTVIAPDADLTEAAQAMERLAVHRLPVVEHGRLVGVLSLKDIALAARKQWASSGPHVAERQLTDIIEAIAAAQAAREPISPHA